MIYARWTWMRRSAAWRVLRLGNCVFLGRFEWQEELRRLQERHQELLDKAKRDQGHLGQLEAHGR